MINVTLGEAKPQEKPFPKLMKSKANETIVFFIKHDYGFMIKGPQDYETPPDSWNMKMFTDYNEPITIQNA